MSIWLTCLSSYSAPYSSSSHAHLSKYGFYCSKWQSGLSQLNSPHKWPFTHKHKQSWRVALHLIMFFVAFFRADLSVEQEMVSLPSHSPVCICLICHGVFSVGQVSWRFLPCCWLLWWMPASPPCRPCGRTSWQPQAEQIGTFTTTIMLQLAFWGIKTPSPLSAFWPRVFGLFWSPHLPLWFLWILPSSVCGMCLFASSSLSRSLHSSGCF